jgi:hypothetical protein
VDFVKSVSRRRETAVLPLCLEGNRRQLQRLGQPLLVEETLEEAWLELWRLRSVRGRRRSAEVVSLKFLVLNLYLS